MNKDEAKEFYRAQREALHELDAEEYVQACGDRRIIGHDALASLPKPVWISGLLTQGGVYGLAGPAEAGKSLISRDWLMEVAATGRRVLYMPTEGQFDMQERFEAHPLFAAARNYLAYFEGGFSFSSSQDRQWLAGQFGSHPPVLIVSDMIYGHGLPDDTGMKDVGPVLGGCKELARQTGAAVLITGHPGHNGERRFRGSSMWRGAFDGEFHMADGSFTCEKHKYRDKRQIRWSYTVEFPHLRALQPMDEMARAAQRMAAIEEDLRINPGESDLARAQRLASRLGLGVSRARKVIAEYKKSREVG